MKAADFQRAFRLVAALTVVGALQSCNPVEPYVPTPTPKMIHWVNDAFATTGIRATPDAIDADSSSSGAIVVDWEEIDPGTVAGVRLGGYNVYRSKNLKWSDPLSFSRASVVYISPSGNDHSYVDLDVEPGYIYSYYVKSFNRSDESQESPPSDTVQFRLTTRPAVGAPNNTISLPSDGPLRFYFGPREAAGYVAIEIDEVKVNQERDVIQVMWKSASEYADYSDPHVDYNGPSPLLPGHRYRWRIIRNTTDGLIPFGNSSKWQAFDVK